MTDESDSPRRLRAAPAVHPQSWVAGERKGDALDWAMRRLRLAMIFCMCTGMLNLALSAWWLIQIGF